MYEAECKATIAEAQDHKLKSEIAETVRAYLESESVNVAVCGTRDGKQMRRQLEKGALREVKTKFLGGGIISTLVWMFVIKPLAKWIIGRMIDRILEA